MRLPDPARSHVVLIGTATHARESDLPDLPAVANNLTDLARALADPLHGWLTPQSHTVIRDPAGAHDLGPLLVDIAQRPDELLLIYFAGHGLLDARGNLYLALAGTRCSSLRYTAFPYDGIRDAVLDSPAANRVVILDCCYSGRAVDVMNDPEGSAYDQINIAGTYVLTATTAITTARAPADARHTAFTGELINLLRTGDVDAPDPLTLDHIYRQLHRRLARSGHPRPQQRDTDGAAQLALARNPAHHYAHARGGLNHSDRGESASRREDLPSPIEAAENATEAMCRYTQLVPEYTRVFGPDNVETLRVRQRLGYYTGSAGNTAEAVRLFAKLVPDTVRVLGPEHPLTLLCRESLAGWIGETGDAAEAVRRYRELAPKYLRVLGPDDSETLRFRRLFGYYVGESGDRAEAVRLLSELVPHCVRVFGPDDSETLNSRRILAYCTGRAGDAAEARYLFSKLVPTCIRVLGPEHPDTLFSRDGLAGWTGESGNPAEAAREYAALIPHSIRVLGPDNPQTLHVRRLLGYYTAQIGDADEAMRLYAEVLPDCVRVLGTEPSGNALHPRGTRERGPPSPVAAAREAITPSTLSRASDASDVPGGRPAAGPQRPRRQCDLAGWKAMRMTPATRIAMPIHPTTMPAVARPAPVFRPAESLISLRARYPKTSASTAPIPANHSTAISSDAMARPLGCGPAAAVFGSCGTSRAAAATSSGEPSRSSTLRTPASSPSGTWRRASRRWPRISETNSRRRSAGKAEVASSRRRR